MAKLDAFFKLMFDTGASDLHIVAGQPPILRVHGELERVKYDPLDDENLRADALRDRPRAEDQDVRGDGRRRLRLRDPQRRALPRQLLQAEVRLRRRLPPDPDQGPHRRRARAAADPQEVGDAAQGPRARDRADRLRQVHHAGRHHRPRQQGAARTTSSRSRTRSSSCTTARAAWSTTARWASHTRSFAAALRGALREDPDIILVGEMRDLETIRLALEAANTGHLVFGTLHTTSAAKTIDRVIEVFPAEEQAQVRNGLSTGLKVVVAQNLFKRVDKKGRVRGAGDPGLHGRRRQPDPRGQDRADPLGDPDRQAVRHADARRRHHGRAAEGLDQPRRGLRQVHRQDRSSGRC